MGNPCEVNPYQAPAAVGANAGEAASTRGYAAWGAVFIVNLAVPLLVGWAGTQKSGRSGMLAAVALLFAVGCWLCATARRVSKALMVGGVAVGLSQAVPVLQLMAGMAGVGLVELSGLDEPTRPTGDAHVVFQLTNEVSGFIATLVTGGLLMSAAVVVGLAIRRLFSAIRGR